MPKKADRARAARRAAAARAEGDAPGAASSQMSPRGVPSRIRAAATVTLPSSSVQNEFGRMLDQARDYDIVVTRHDVPRAVLVSAERYRELVGREAAILETLQAQFDALYAQMQTPEVQAGTTRGFRTTPTEMGQAAVAAAQRARHSPRAVSQEKADTRTAKRTTRDRRGT